MRTRYRYCTQAQKWLPESEFIEREESRSASIIQDSIAPFVSHLDGKVYESKSAYRRTLKAAGMVELGNDQPTTRRQESGGMRRDLERAWRDLNS